MGPNRSELGPNRSEYIGRINRVLDYVDANIGDELPVERLAAVAAFSQFHFSRIFSAMVGEPVGTYVRRVRLEKAAWLLVSRPSEPVTGIAMDCGFSSAAVFARAFRERFGMSASQWRAAGGNCPDGMKCKTSGIDGQSDGMDRNARRPAYGYAPFAGSNGSNPTNTEQIMQVTIEKFDAIRAAYVRRMGPYAESATDAWATLCRWAAARGLLIPEAKMFGVSHDDPDTTSPDRLRYDACIVVGPDIVPTGEIGIAEWPAATVARFNYRGPGTGIKEAYRRFFGEWLPDSGYLPADRPSFEICRNDPSDGIFDMDVIVAVIPAP